jgi:hypothetical protein
LCQLYCHVISESIYYRAPPAGCVLLFARDALLAICITCPAGEWRANLSYPELEFKATVVRTHADRAIEGEYLRPMVSLPYHAAIDRDTHLAALYLRAQGVGVATTKWGTADQRLGLMFR